MHRPTENGISLHGHEAEHEHPHDHHHDHEHTQDHDHMHPHDHGHDHTHDHDHPHEHGHSHPHVHENTKLVVNRLARAIGHLEKVKNMVEDGVDCSEVLVQLAAVRGALDSTGRVILRDHIQHCIVDAVEEGDETAVFDLCDAIDKFMK